MHGSQKFPCVLFKFICMRIGKKLQPFSISSILASSFLCLKKYLRILVESGLLLYLYKLMYVKFQETLNEILNGP